MVRLRLARVVDVDASGSAEAVTNQAGAFVLLVMQSRYNDGDPATCLYCPLSVDTLYPVGYFSVIHLRRKHGEPQGGREPECSGRGLGGFAEQ